MAIHKSEVSYPFDKVLASFTECKLAVEDQQRSSILSSKRKCVIDNFCSKRLITSQEHSG